MTGPAEGGGARAIIGAAFEVHALLGPGYLEQVYQEALAMEFGMRAIPYEREVHMPVVYKGRRLSTLYRADFVCFTSIVVELKVIQSMGVRDTTQVLGYMRSTGHASALLLNFGLPRLQFKRLGHGVQDAPAPSEN